MLMPACSLEQPGTAWNSLTVDGAQTCRCYQRECMKGITWRLSRFIIIAAESFHPRWLANAVGSIPAETDLDKRTCGSGPGGQAVLGLAGLQRG